MTLPNVNPTVDCGVPSGCCPESLPEVLTLTITNIQDCACADGASIKLYYDPDPVTLGPRWKGSGSLETCGSDVVFTLECTGDSAEGFELMEELCFAVPEQVSGSCDPLNLVFSDGGSPCCDDPATASVEITITE